MKKILEAYVPGIDRDYDEGEQIYPIIGIMKPPPWYYSLHANRFRSIATTAQLLRNVMQSFLQSFSAFEVYCNDELVSDPFAICVCVVSI
ncbi:hypothetical protein CXB51_008732 [Gossypium anomalum]|uniref:Uncharacterized protein n=1 Tax=Gossypium anomalum TaxID=47600 RepID=A0A8J5ZKD8_9ROSI|nr:hypothetical protein CXB51_008732 [Gossypium anomalum]